MHYRIKRNIEIYFYKYKIFYPNSFLSSFLFIFFQLHFFFSVKLYDAYTFENISSCIFKNIPFLVITNILKRMKNDLPYSCLRHSLKETFKSFRKLSAKGNKIDRLHSFVLYALINAKGNYLILFWFLFYYGTIKKYMKIFHL